MSGLSGKLLLELAPGWKLELGTGPGRPMGRGANQGQGNMGFDDTGGPMGAAQAIQGQTNIDFDKPGSSTGRGANQGQRSMILDEPGGPMVEQPPQMRASKGRSRQEGIIQYEGFLYTDF